MAAIRGGVAVDTTFGISPQSGLPHNNRTGDLDVFAALFAMKKLNLSVDEIANILTYTLNTWGNDGGVVTSKQVQAVRAGTKRPEGAAH